MRLARDARLGLDALCARDALARLGRRLAWWASLAFLLRSALTLASVLWDYPELAFHAATLLSVAVLPGALFLPSRGEPFVNLIRGIDEHTAIEAWLGYPGGPAEAMLAKRAEEVLRVRSAYRPGRRGPGRGLALVALAGLICFASAQLLSVARGYGISLGWADKSAAMAPQEGTPRAEDGSPTSARLIPGLDIPERESGAVSPYRPDRAGDQDEADLARNPGGAGATPGGQEGTSQPAEGRTGQPGPGAEGGGGRVSGAVSPDGAARGRGTGSAAAASAPGYEGGGASLLSSPLVEYRAAFQKAYAERTGRESAVSGELSAGMLESALSEYYSSFDLRVAVDGSLDPGLEALKRAWLDAFAAGGSR